MEVRKILAGGIIIAGIISSTAAFAAQLEELSVKPFIEIYDWSEFNDGTRVLRESGERVGIGVVADVDFYNKQLMLRAKGDIFGGSVDYEGHTQDMPEVVPDNSNPGKFLLDWSKANRPVNTNVIYFGSRLEGDLGWRLNPGGASLEPFAGLGYRWWLRDLQDSTAIDTNGSTFEVGGYSEIWQEFYTKIGVRTDIPLTKKLGLFAEGGAKYPFYTLNSAEDSGGWVHLEPKGNVSGFAEVGLRIDRFRPSFFYEGTRYAESPHVQISPATGTLPAIEVFQPETKSDIYGFSLQITF